jgi:hypothetical protein
VAANVTSALGRALVLAALSDTESDEVRSARAAFWRERFQAAATLAREALNGSATDAEVGVFIERLIGPLFLRVFITGVPVTTAFLRGLVRTALATPYRSERRGAARTVVRRRQQRSH